MSDNALSSDKLVDLWMHQNSLVWSKIKTATALQAGIIAGWYYSMTDDLPEIATPLAILGAFLMVVLIAIVMHDITARNQVRDSLETRNTPLPFASGKRGADRFMLGLIMLSLFGCDAALGWYSIKYPHSMAAPAEDDSDQTVAHRVVNCQFAETAY